MGLRFVVLFMVVLLFCSTFGACGDSEDSNDEKKKDTTGDDDSGFDEFGDEQKPISDNCAIALHGTSFKKKK